MRQAAYLHLPFCRRRCFYCDFPISVVGDRARGETSGTITDYVHWLCREIQATPHDGASLHSVFLGGGTPSLLSPDQVERILITLDQRMGIASGAEISMEMDPGTFTLAQLRSLQAAGINRVSLGVQAFQEDLLAACGRSHRRSDIEAAATWISQAQVANWSLDLISGLPGQTLAQWEESLNCAIALGPTHLSCYDLVLEPPTVFAKREAAGQLKLPPQEETAMMYRLACDQLPAAGFQHYEISNYARSGYQCRHNLTYWRNQSFYGFGMGASSYHDQRRVARPNRRVDYYAWVEGLEQQPATYFQTVPPLSWRDRLFETLMVGLRLTAGIDITALAQEFGESALAPVVHQLRSFVAQGWVVLDAEGGQVRRLRLTDPEGLLYSNQVLVSILETLEAPPLPTSG